MPTVALVALALLGLATSVPSLPSLLGQRFVLRLGDADATSPAVAGRACYAKQSSAISAPLQDAATGVRYRTLAESNQLMVLCNLSSWDASETGVPFVDAVLSVRYRDEYDETRPECTNTAGNAACRDTLYARLNRGTVTRTWLGDLGGLNDSQWKSLEVVMWASPFQLLQRIGDVVTFYITNIATPWRPTRLAIEGLNLSFVSREEAESVRERLNLARGMKTVEYRNGTLERDPPMPAVRRPFALFSRHYLEHVFSNSVPRTEELADPLALRVQEIQGEDEPVTLSLWAFEELAGVTVTPSGLEGVAEVTVFEVMQEDRRWGSSFDKYHGQNPWSLRPLVYPLNESYRSLGNWDRAFHSGVVTVPRNTTRQFWLNVGVLRSAKAGEHEGKVTVCSQSRCQDVKLALNVLEVDLGPPDAEPYIYYSPFLQNLWGSDKRYVLQDIKKHGPYLAPLVYGRGVILPNGTVDFSPRLEPEVDALRDSGILNVSRRVRLFYNDNWAQLWNWTYGSTTALQGRTESAEFDERMRSVLRQYSTFFASYGLTVDNSFADEPGINVVKRRISAHLMRLAKEVGQSTWATWYTNCETPLAGHDFFLVPPANPSGMKTRVPSWLSSDPQLRVWFDFPSHANSTSTVVDKSGKGNHGTLVGGAKVINGVLLVNSSSAVSVPDNPSLDLPSAITVLVNLRLDAIPKGYADHPVQKLKGTTEANFVIYVFGPSNPGSLVAYATTPVGWASVPSTPWTIRAGDSAWHQVLWSYDSTTGGQILLDQASTGFSGARGNLTTSSAPLKVGEFVGAVEQFILLGRALTLEEKLALSTNPEDAISRASLSTVVSSSLVLEAGARVLRFSTSDFDLPSWLYSSAWKLFANNEQIWSHRGQETETHFHTVSLPDRVLLSPTVNVTFVLEAGRQADHFRLYFMHKFWRDTALWQAGGIVSGGAWKYDYTADPMGDLGPLHQWLDDAVITPYSVNDKVVQWVKSLGMMPSFYTTYFANTPVGVYNRVFNGVIASSLGAPTVNVFAHAGWCSDPWDEQSGRSGDFLAAGNRRYEASYALVQPSWDPMVISTTAWETLREGLEDSRVIRRLKDALTAHPDHPVAANATAYLKKVLSGINKDVALTYMKWRNPEPEPSLRADTSDLILKDLCGSPVAFSCLDDFRLKLIQFVQALSRPPKTSSSSARPTTSSSPFKVNSVGVCGPGLVAISSLATLACALLHNAH